MSQARWKAAARGSTSTRPGWSSAPKDRYRKNDMADDLAGVCDRLGVGPVKLVAHDWGGPVATIFLLRHPEKVAAFMGLNTAVPWLKHDREALIGHERQRRFLGGEGFVAWSGPAIVDVLHQVIIQNRMMVGGFVVTAVEAANPR